MTFPLSDLLASFSLPFGPSADVLEGWLREEDPHRLFALFSAADQVRREHVGDAVHLRGLVEVSSYCRRRCLYCGLRGCREIARYRLSAPGVVSVGETALRLGLGTVVLQSGEDLALTAEWTSEVVRGLKAAGVGAVTLSFGERSREELLEWRRAGADRYLLRFETSRPELYRAIHPGLVSEPGFRASSCESSPEDRIGLLRYARSIGYEIGSGVMVGIPGQRYRDLAADLLTFRALDLDMVGVGPFLPHPDVPLGAIRRGVGPSGERVLFASSPCESEPVFLFPDPGAEQVPNTNAMTFKVMALTRLLLPWSNIPSTTAVTTLDPSGGRRGGLSSGANVLMPNITPTEYRELYEIYPTKAGVGESASETVVLARAQAESSGRYASVGSGASASYFRREKRGEGFGRDS